MQLTAFLGAVAVRLRRIYPFVVGLPLVGLLIFAAFAADDALAGTVIGFGSLILFIIILRHDQIRIRSVVRDQIVQSIRKNFEQKKLQGMAVEELYLLSEYYKDRASSSGRLVILILVGLSIGVAFAGQILLLDSNRFSSLNDYRNDLSQQRRTLDDLRNFPTVPESVLQDWASSMRSFQEAYQKALDKQTSSEEAMFGTAYRIAASLLLRISILGVGIYLVIIVNRSFKFNSALSSFYKARYLAALRGTDDLEQSIKYVTFMSAEPIEYSVDLEHPTDRLMKVFDKISDFFARERSPKPDTPKPDSRA